MRLVPFLNKISHWILFLVSWHIYLISYKIQVPKDSLLFVIPAFGGTVSWEGDGSPFGEADEQITHQVHILLLA